MKLVASINFTKKDFQNTKLKLEKKELIKGALGKGGRIYKVESDAEEGRLDFYIDIEGKNINPFRIRMGNYNVFTKVISTKETIEKKKDEVEVSCWSEIEGTKQTFTIKKDSVVEMIRIARSINGLSGFPLFRKEFEDHILLYNNEGKRKVNMKVGR